MACATVPEVDTLGVGPGAADPVTQPHPFGTGSVPVMLFGEGPLGAEVCA